MKTNLKLCSAGFLTLLLLFFAQLSFAQSPIRCYTDEMDEILRANHPELGSKEEFEAWLQNEMTQNEGSKIIGGVYTIPVVVHVIHNGEAVGTGTNVSFAAIQSQIDVLNEDFRRIIGTNGYNTHPDGADTQIEFCLAMRRPDGSAFTAGQPGVNRINRSTAGFTAPPYSTAYIDGTIKPYTYNGGVPTATRGWDPNKYMNIWLCNISGGILGYAQFPQTPLGGMGCNTPAAATDGVVFLYNSIGKSSVTGFGGIYNEGRTATHEIGHWLGLRHIWGDGGCGVDDYCNDTPLAAAANYNCVTVNSCTAAPDAGNDMIENYMDYTNDLCMNIFTNDQKARMRTVLTSSSLRVNLINSDACTPPNPSDASIVNVLQPLGDNCPGTLTPQVTLRNRGSNNLTSATINYTIDGGAVTTFNWTGVLAPSAEVNVTLPGFTAPLGAHLFSAYSTMPNGVTDPSPLYDTTGINFMISNGITAPYSQNFEANVFPPDLRWVANNANGDCYNWIGGSATSITGVLNNNAALFPAYGNNSSSTDNLITPIFILPCNATAANIQFDVAYRRRNNTPANYERLYVEISENCGATWNATPIYDKTGTALQVLTTTTTNYYTPVGASDWRTETINLLPFVTGTSKNVKFRIRAVAANGNNIYLDNFRFNATTPGEIQVFQSATEILDEGFSQMGTVAVGSSVNVTYTINNTGTSNLILTGPINVTGAQFAVVSSFGTTTVPAGGSTTFVLSFTPSGAGQFTGNVSFGTNDCDEGTYNFQLNGTGNVTPPVAGFTAAPTTICAGGTVTFTNTSTNATSYSWSFPGGTPATSTAVNPTVTYATAGNYNVTLTATNAFGSDVQTSTNYITVLAGSAGTPVPYVEGFVATTFAPTGWSIVNGGTANTWARSGTVGTAPTAGNSAIMDNYSGANSTGSVDDLVIKPMDLTGLVSAQMTFDVAYARYGAANFEQLDILVSTNCGGSYTNVYSKSGTTLATDADVTSAYTPGNWRNEVIDLTPFIGNAKVDIIFRNTSGWGNNLYLDNINLSGVVGGTPPTASFTGTPTAICAGQTVTYTNTSTGSPTSYSWSFPGGTPATSTATNPTITYPTAGTYNVTLTATNGFGSNVSNQTNYITVTAPPVAGTLTGTQNICVSATTTFSSTQTGGTWSSSNTGIATVNATTGVVTGVAAGTATITYTVAGTGGCSNATATRTVTVTAAPVAGTLSGTQNICVSSTTTFSSTQTGGTWSSSNTGIATVNATTGVVTGVSAGTATITYTVAGTGGCSNATATRTVTVTAAPVAGTLSGTQNICVSSTTTFSSTQTGGTWSSSNTGIATVNATTGVVTGVSAGTATITYTVAGTGGCSNATATRTVTVTAAPVAGTLSGTQNICVSSTTTFSSTQTGGTWSSSNTGIATVNATTGVVTGVSAGTATITYTVAGTGGCSNATATRTVTVTAAPVAGTLSGTQNICVSSTTSFSSTQTGGTWSSSNTGIATVNATTGVVTGVSAGTATITYTVAGTGGCSNATATRTVTVTAAPVAGTLSGTQNICVSSTTTFSSTQTGGTWSSSNTGIATVNATTGVVTGVAAGTATITYTVAGTGGCSNATATRTVTVTAAPVAGTLSGTQNICVSSTTTFSSTQTGGTWSSSNTAIATVNATTGVVTGVSAGTATITYTVAGTGGCSNATATRTVTVNPSPVISVSGQSNPTDCVTADGTITISGSGTGTISWSGASSGSSVQTLPYTITGLVGGSYTINFNSSCPSNSVMVSLSAPSAPSAPVVTVTDNCGSSILTATGSNLVWSTGETTSSITVTTAGAYTVTQTVGGCTSSAATGNANPTAVPSAPVVTVTDNCGSSILTATGSNLVWSTGETTSSITVTTAGTYTVTQAVGGCTSSAATGNANPTATPSAPIVTVTDNCGSSILTATGSNLVWSTGETTSSITVTTAGAYTVTQTVGGCTSSAATGNANPTATPSAPIVTVTDNCGSSILTATGSNLVWSTGETTSSISVTTAGAYTVTQTVGGCTSSAATGNANPTAVPSAPIVTVTDNCGSSILTATGSNLVWSTGETTSSIIVTTAGAYTVTQTVGGCTSSAATGNANPTATPITPIVTVTDNCGSSILTATGSNLVWSTGETTSSITVTTAGAYTVTQTVGGCTSSVATGNANPTAVPSAPIVTVTDNCGSSILTATGSNLVWSTGETTSSITVTTAGAYTVTQTVGGCTSSAATGNANPTATPSAPIVTVTDNCGSSVLSATGSNLVWSTGETSSSITVVSAGTYTVTQTVGGCTSSAASGNANPITTPSAPIVTVTDNCGNSTLTATGSNLVWSTGETTTSITVINGGTYYVTQSVGGCSSASTSAVATPLIVPTVSHNPLPDVCVNNTPFVLSGGTPAGGVYSGNGVSGSTFDPSLAGVGTWFLNYTFTAANGCSNTASTSILVDACASIDEQAIVIGISPNPTSGSVQLKSNSQLDSYSIYDYAGRLVESFDMTGLNEVEIDLSVYADGVYHIIVKSNDFIQTERIVLKK